MKTIHGMLGVSTLVRCAVTVSLAVLVAGGGMPDGAAQAQERPARNQKRPDARARPGGDAAKPPEDPAEVQRLHQVNQQAKHWEQQFTILLYGDLELLRAICGDLPRESRRAIARAGAAAVTDAAVRMAELQMGGRRNQRPQAGGAKAEKSPDNPSALVSAALITSVAEHVGAEQATAFSAQVARRSDRRKAVMIREIVALLDGELVLTAAQREEIERSLGEQWNDAMAMTLQGNHMNNGLRVFPGLPGGCVSPHLTEAQRQRFVPQPDANNRMRGAWQHQAWMQTVHMLNNVQPVGRDPWWFE